ncbi:MAG: hypothetical protein ABJA69_05640 [Acidobacteriaceae bacterium]
MTEIYIAAQSAFFASRLRAELSVRNRRYAAHLGLSMCETYGAMPSVCYQPSEDGLSHGNFAAESYRAILRTEGWSRRLFKVHTQGRTSLPRSDRRWRELDSCNSSDALLMNIVCYPETLAQSQVLDFLGVEQGAVPEFGFRAKVPFANGRSDRTEVDMLLGNLLVEAKLTEFDFQSKAVGVVGGYRDFHEVFDVSNLPRKGDSYLSYQLIRNVLAAHADQRSFCVVADARRPDLREAWYAIMRSVRIVDLRLRCKMLTWQELSEFLPKTLQDFLRDKYGISAAPLSDYDEERQLVAGD